MIEIESRMKEENENNKELFNFQGDEAQLKELYTNYIKNSRNGLNYFIQFLEHYYKCRTNQNHISKELVECIYYCFPEQINEIQQKIKNTEILKFIIFPEEFPMVVFCVVRIVLLIFNKIIKMPFFKECPC